jgi:hypothetical protein
VEELLPKARELAYELGTVPSRNRLMSEFRIGSKKATTIRKELATVVNGAGNPGSIRLGLMPDIEHAKQTESEHPALSTEEPDRDENDGPGSPDPASGTAEDGDPSGTVRESSRQVAVDVDPGSPPEPISDVDGARPVRTWPVLLLALPAFVAIWSGWVGLGGLTGFGVVHPLPGIADSFGLNTAITLPIGVETYAAYALRAWLAGHVPVRARRFAKRSAIASLGIGALGQIAYHLMTAAGMRAAPWWITTVVACLPVAVLGMGAALAHLLHSHEPRTRETPAPPS